MILKSMDVTNSMEHSPYREASKTGDTQEIPRILWNSKVLTTVLHLSLS